MSSPKSRTAVLAAPLVLGLLSGCAGNSVARPTPTPSVQDRANRALAQIEHRFHARLGVYVADNGRTVTYRADERFAYASTFKVLAAGVLLKRAPDLDRLITYRASDLVDYSPVTSKHVGKGMTLRELMAAALQVSDNTAANLLVDQLGGPSGLQAALRDLGDTTSHVDRTEPALNDATPGDIRDTSTPRALGTDLHRFVLGDVLPESRRRLLTNWLVGNTTGGPYIRAGVPSGWKVGDKTGNGGYGTRNDIAIVWPPSASPIDVAIESDRASANASSDDALIADATKAALAALRQRG
jgi:beta-lactamase class A